MEIRKIDDTLAVAGQIAPEDVEQIAAAGFRAILCNRPDNEGLLQPTYDDVAQAAKRAGLTVAYQPVNGAAITAQDVAAFDTLCQSLPKPVLAYCRTGTRCTVLWSLSQAKTREVPQILEMAAAAGYDLSGMADRILAARTLGD